jgi:hypothetical protein
VSHKPRPIFDPENPGHRPKWVFPITCRHKSESRRLILRAAEQAVTGRAVVLGAGACREIPLAELVARFDHVTLNDINSEDVQRAAAQIDPAGREKLAIQIADLTGVVDPVLARIRQRLSECIDPRSAFDAMAESLDASPSFSALGQFHLVIASCVLSQLHYALTHRSDALLEQRFPGHVEQLRNSPRWAAGLAQLARRMKATFLDGLVRSTVPGGFVYLSDSVQLCNVHLTAAGRWKTGKTYRTVRSARLEDVLDDRLTVVEQARWEWVGTAPSATRSTGRVYEVQALLLTARKGAMPE